MPLTAGGARSSQLEAFFIDRDPTSKTTPDWEMMELTYVHVLPVKPLSQLVLLFCTVSLSDADCDDFQECMSKSERRRVQKTQKEHIRIRFKHDANTKKRVWSTSTLRGSFYAMSYSGT